MQEFFQLTLAKLKYLLLINLLTISSASRSSFYDIDGYSIDIIKDKKKSKIVISQRNKFRKIMNYPIPEEFEYDFKTTVIELNYKQIAQTIYDLFNKPPYRQETLF